MNLNLPGMTVENFEGGFLTHYTLSCDLDNPILRSLTEYEANSITFHRKNGCTQHMIPPRVIRLFSFHTQFGVALSKDQRCFFLQSWARGLFCFSMETGGLLWNVRIKHGYNLIVNEDAAICYFVNNGIYHIDLQNGQIIQRIPFTTDGSFYPLGDGAFAYGPVRGKYQLRDHLMNPIAEVSISRLNSQNLEVFVLKALRLSGNVLLAYVYESSREEECKARKEDTSNMLIHKNRRIKAILLD